MQSQTYAQGTEIWIKHEEEVWIQAEIVTSNDKEIIVKTYEDPNSRIVLGPHEPIFLRTSQHSKQNTSKHNAPIRSNTIISTTKPESTV
eukprot:symbB.v1.2.010471.t1/scaffold679.1/size173156/7